MHRFMARARACASTDGVVRHVRGINKKKRRQEEKCISRVVSPATLKCQGMFAAVVSQGPRRIAERKKAVFRKAAR